MRIAALQMAAKTGDVPANLARIADAAERAAGFGAKLLVAPEMALTGYGAGNRTHSLADRDGAQPASIARIAARTGVAVAAGFAERSGGVTFNSAVLARPDGVFITYRKRRLYGPYEQDLFAIGDAVSPLIEIDGLKVGLLICFDLEFPEMARELALAGADIIAVPTALPAGMYSPFVAKMMVPTRAFENQLAVIYANHVGSDDFFTYAGRSAIVLPDGSDAARGDDDSEALLIADYDSDAFESSRIANPYLSALRARG